jgi:anti-sigma factor RsiW
MNERAEDLIVLAALGELTAEERLELDGLAAADPAVAAELAAELDTAAQLMSATPIDAPASLRASVLEAIGDVAQVAPAEAPAAVVSIEERRERRSRRLLPILSAAAAVVLVVGGAVVLTGGDDSSGDEFALVADAPDAVERDFVGMADAELRLVYSPSEDAIVLDGNGVPSLDDAQTYVLWLIRDGEATPAAEFRPDTSGEVSARFDGIDPSDAVLGITAEPIGAVTTPTEPILATA